MSVPDMTATNASLPETVLHETNPTTVSARRRAVAGFIAALGFFGLAIQLVSSTLYFHDFGHALWGMARYYTNIGNLIVAICMAGLALGRPWAARPMIIGGATLNAALIGIVYAVLLGGHHNPGESYTAMVLLHRVVPPLIALFWLALVPRGGLRWVDPIAWGVPPLVYLPYALLRGEMDGRFPYFFIDLARLGWLPTLRNAALLTLAFMLVGALMVWLDKALAARRSAVPAP